MDKLHFLTVIYFILEHFTVLKQIHPLDASRVLGHFTVLKQTCSAFLKFLRFESIILADSLSIFCEYTRYFKKFKQKKIFSNSFFTFHTDFQILKHSKKLLCFGLYSWLFSISLNVTKTVFITKTRQKLDFVICTKMQNCVLLWKWYRFSLKKWTTFHRSDFRIEINNDICRCRHMFEKCWE